MKNIHRFDLTQKVFILHRVEDNGPLRNFQRDLASSERIQGPINITCAALSNIGTNLVVEHITSLKAHRTTSPSLAHTRSGFPAMGSRIVNRAPPRVGRFSTVIVPPCAWTMPLQIERPRPVPPDTLDEAR